MKFKKPVLLISEVFTNIRTKYPAFLLVFLLLVVSIIKLTTNVFAVEDTEAPTTPTNLHISNTSPNSVTIAWNASTDNVGVEGYKIYKNGLFNTDTALLTHTFYNLPSGSHVFQVRAFDLAQNLSGFSNFVIYLSTGMTGPTPTPTSTPTPTFTPTPTPTETPTPTYTPTPTFTPSPTPTLTIVNFNPMRDIYVRSSGSNDNEGASTILRVQNSGAHRSIVDFGTAPIYQLGVGPSDIVSAVLRVTITNNGNNWGATGRTIELHRVIKNWAEGNGNNGFKGTGSGATWNCAIDSNINNGSANCSGVTDWDMTMPNDTIWSTVVTDTKTIMNNQSGVVEFNVTADVRGILQGTPYYGWVIKRTSESTSGSVNFGSRESGTPPELIVTHK